MLQWVSADSQPQTVEFGPWPPDTSAASEEREAGAASTAAAAVSAAASKPAAVSEEKAAARASCAADAAFASEHEKGAHKDTAGLQHDSVQPVECIGALSEESDSYLFRCVCVCVLLCVGVNGECVLLNVVCSS